MIRFIIIAWLLIPALSLMADVRQLKVTALNGSEQLISVTDGLEVTFADSNLIISDNSNSVSYSLADVRKMQYVFIDPTVSIDRIESSPRINITPQGVELSQPGAHRLNVVSLNGTTLLTTEFTDNIIIDRQKLPSGIFILVIDNSLSLKISSK